MATLTIDELVETLKRSTLPTVLVEGPDDVQVYRGLEDIIGSLNASFHICGGRPTLLAVFDRRSEFSGKRVCFVADKDMWMFGKVPDKDSEIVLTDGYSIENDVYQDGTLERLIHRDERPNHTVMIDELSRWFAFQVEEFRSSRPYLSDPKLGYLIPIPGFTCSQIALDAHGFRNPDDLTYQEVRNEYERKLRGKLLFEVIVRFSHAAGRQPRHSYDSLLEIAVAYGAQGVKITALVNSIKAKLSF